jgi:cyclin D3
VKCLRFCLTHSSIWPYGCLCFVQVEEARYLYEAKTIMRMEILVLTTLRWDMNPVTPLSFLDYITRRLGLKDHLCYEFLRKCERILLSVLTGKLNHPNLSLFTH